MTDGEFVGTGGESGAEAVGPDGQVALRAATGAALAAGGDLDGAFFDLYDRMIGDVDIPSVLAGVADVVCSHLGAEAATIYLIDRDTAELVSAAVIGNVTQTIRVPIREDSLAGYCALTGRSFVTADAYGDLSDIDPKLKFDRSWDQATGFRTRDVMCSPSTFKGEVLGVVQVINSKAQPGDLGALKYLARLIGYALYHARLFDDLATLKRLEKEKAQFMRVMAHELKSPVGAAKMLTGALKIKHDDSDQVQHLTGRIAARMDQMLELIGDLLDLAKVKAGGPLSEITVLDLTAATAEGCAAYAEQAEGKNLTLQTQLPAKALPVRMDAKGYSLVLSNLLSNAIKYTPAGTVEVTLTAEDKQAVLTVKDSGIGIPAADIPRLFREFFRASNAKKQQLPGSGVGLSGAKAIIERFGGRIELDSQENVGTTFTVRLPISSE